jgi:hypothetical protein
MPHGGGSAGGRGAPGTGLPHARFAKGMSPGGLVVEISVEGERVVFEVEGWDKLWSLRSRLEIPLAHITGAHWDPEPAMGWFEGLKLGGTAIPNLFRAGTFYQDGGLVFWDVAHPERTIVIDLVHETYGKLVVEVAEPMTAVSLITRSIGGRGKTS